MSSTKKLELEGKTYNNLTGIKSDGHDNHGKIVWLFHCSCGKEHRAVGSAVVQGRIKSCGCYHKEVLTERNTTHGMSRTSEYESWLGMWKRCTNPETPSYKNYGGRGITVDPSWEFFNVFMTDMGRKPAGTSIDRIDNSKGYSKENCRWATRGEQCNNQRSNLKTEYQGEVKNLKQWAVHLGIPYLRLYRQVRTNGLTMKEALKVIQSRSNN